MATANTLASATQKNPHFHVLSSATGTASGAIADVIVYCDPNKRIHIECDMGGDPLTIMTTKNLNSTNDLEDASQGWVTNQSAITTDYQSGDIGDTGFRGIKLVFGTTTVATSYMIGQEPVVNKSWKKQ
jgi:hypothetical protein